VLPIRLRYGDPPLLDVRGGIPRDLVPGNGTSDQALMLTTYSTVGDGSVHIGIHVADDIALIDRGQGITRTFLPVVVLKDYSLVGREVAILFAA
jgi:hypothetical protein